jgi:hypothetical protein
LSVYSKRDVERAWKEYQDSYGEPKTVDKWACDGNWRLVGNGSVSSESCGQFVGFKGCADSGAHFGVTSLDGVSYHNKAYVEYRHKHCDSYNCPVCYLSWATREAHRIEERLRVHSEVYGEVYHIVASIPKKWKIKSSMDEKGFSRLCSRVLSRLKVRGVIGGVSIFHGFRYANQVEAKVKKVKFGWRWSTHFHFLGYISDVKTFYSRCRDVYKKDHLLVKKLAKRQSVFGTAWYQLNHASVLVGVKKFNVARWFGVAREKVVVAKFEAKCPICQAKLKKLKYFGSEKLELSYQQLEGLPKRFFADIIDGEDSVLLWADG